MNRKVGSLTHSGQNKPLLCGWAEKPLCARALGLKVHRHLQPSLLWRENHPIPAPARSVLSPTDDFCRKP